VDEEAKKLFYNKWDIFVTSGIFLIFWQIAFKNEHIFVTLCFCDVSIDDDFAD